MRTRCGLSPFVDFQKRGSAWRRLRRHPLKLEIPHCRHSSRIKAQIQVLAPAKCLHQRVAEALSGRAANGAKIQRHFGIVDFARPGEYFFFTNDTPSSKGIRKCTRYHGGNSLDSDLEQLPQRDWLPLA
jgi:hypothetical protein